MTTKEEKVIFTSGDVRVRRLDRHAICVECREEKGESRGHLKVSGDTHKWVSKGYTSSVLGAVRIILDKGLHVGEDVWSKSLPDVEQTILEANKVLLNDIKEQVKEV